MRFRRLIATASILLGVFASSREAGAETATEIIRRADEPFLSTRVYSVSTMISYRSGKERKRETVETYTMADGTTEWSLTIYLEPERMKGTAYLVRGEDVWVRFASTGRVRKLGSLTVELSSSAGDFSIGDLSSSGSTLIERYSATLSNRSVSIRGQRCHQIQMTPREGKNTEYDRLTVHITRDAYRYLKIDYERAGALVKSLDFDDYRPVDGHEYPHRMTMESHVGTTRTEIRMMQVDLDSPRVVPELFTPEYLEQMQ